MSLFYGLDDGGPLSSQNNYFVVQQRKLNKIFIDFALIHKGYPPKNSAAPVCNSKFQ